MVTEILRSHVVSISPAENICGSGGQRALATGKEFYRQSEDAFEEFRVFGLDPQVPGNLIVEANRNANTSLWSFDPDTREFSELLYHGMMSTYVESVITVTSGFYPNLVSGVMHCKREAYYRVFRSQ